MLLKGRTILITGATKGIGKATAQLFAENGANLILLGRDGESLNSVKDQISENSEVNILTFAVDLTSLDAIKNIFTELKKNRIFLDGLVNNAGIMKDAALMMVKPAAVEETFSTNVFAGFILCLLALKSFIHHRKGFIINISSIVGVQGSAGQSVYSASKSALIGFTKSLGKELAPLNIKVNAIAPGFIQTDLIEHINEKQRENVINNIGFKRAGTPEDVAKVVLFLASELSDYVTGQVIGVDGGMII